MDMMLQILAPEIALLIASMALLIGDAFWAKRYPALTFQLTLATLVVVMVIIIATFSWESLQLFNGAFIRDGVADVLKVAMIAMTLLAFIFARDYLLKRDIERGEYYVMGMISLLGMMVLASAYDMISLFMGLEIMSLSLYAMIAMQKDSVFAIESAMKYFVLGAMATGLLLYGMSLVYGNVGSLQFATIYQTLSATGVSLVVGLGLVFILVGLAFKFGAAPFHNWVPDVYHGSPTGITLFLAAAPKIAAFALMFRLLIEGLEVAVMQWQSILIILAVLSLVVGNVVAIAQTNLKRMLAYSTIAHMGFILLGFMTGNIEGYAAAMFYVVTYALMSIGGFGVIVALSRRGFEADNIRDLSGLGRRNPLLALIMLVLLLSMAGIPPFVGFYAKLVVLTQVVEAGFTSLAVFAVLMSVIGAYYYLRVIKVMYFDEPLENMVDAHFATASLRVGLVFVGTLVLLLGIMPGDLLSLFSMVMTY
ncbi:MAG: NADH-quinone oxidoreductase subunit NuoN [Thiotrichales bacterium]|jgi:NADH-quinone oxidoreductase subunit N|nr:NADH-quinone oxidoreductase subunit NuoN [Thiotrichales bacterium]